tara:strand:+ start:3395 stop:3598 length:204 start_codon:yes stop_codon:yes gene_type:complete
MNNPINNDNTAYSQYNFTPKSKAALVAEAMKLEGMQRVIAFRFMGYSANLCYKVNIEAKAHEQSTDS